MRFRFAFILLATAMLAAVSSARAQETQPTPAGSLQRLKDGNARFATDKTNKRDVGADKRELLAKGSRPFAVVLTCADARIAPELLFDAGLGELFVLSVVGNIADPAIVGSVEYAVEHLHAPLIVVLGHDSCAAVAAALDGKSLPGDRGWLVKQIKLGDKLPTDKDGRLAAGVRHNARAAAADLQLRSKLIHEEVGKGKIKIVSAVYFAKTGKIEWLTNEKQKSDAPEKVNPPKAETTPAPVAERRGPYIVERPERFPRLRALFKRWR